jgi:hypothetical protein
MACKNCNDCKDAGCLALSSEDCVLTKSAYKCLGVAAGVPISNVFVAINSALCSLGRNACTPVSAVTGQTTSIVVPNPNGTCPGYQVGIAPAIITQINTSTSNIVTITANITTITNSLTPVWNNIVLLNGFVNQGGVTQTAQYTDSSYSIVRLRGAIESPDYTLGDVLFTLPETPLANRSFSTVVFVQNLLSYTFGIITIDTSGDCTISYEGYNIHDQIRVYLDGISFEIN